MEETPERLVIKGSIRMHEEDLQARLEAMPFADARKAILTRTLGHTFDSPNHAFCLSWLAMKDAELHEQRQTAIVRWARHAVFAGYAAAAASAASIVITILRTK